MHHTERSGGNRWTVRTLTGNVPLAAGEVGPLGLKDIVQYKEVIIQTHESRWLDSHLSRTRLSHVFPSPRCNTRSTDMDPERRFIAKPVLARSAPFAVELRYSGSGRVKDLPFRVFVGLVSCYF